MASTSSLDTIQKRRLVNPMAVLFLLVALLAVIGTPYLPTYYIRVVDGLLIYILLGCGLNIVVGYTGLLDLGFIAFYAIGAYTYATLASGQFGIHLPLLAILPVACALGVLMGVLLGIPVLHLRGDYLAIVTLGFGEIIRIVLNNLDWLTNGPNGIARLDKPTLFGLEVGRPSEMFYVLLATAITVGVLVWRLEKSILGKAWAAIREDQDSASGVGINTTRAKLAAFATSAAIASIAGVLFAASQRFVSPESFSLQESVLIVLLIVIGGVGNILGVIVGAVVLVVLPELLREFAEWRVFLLGVLMVVLIVLRPDGLVPRTFGPEKLLGALFKR